MFSTPVRLSRSSSTSQSSEQSSSYFTGSVVPGIAPPFRMSCLNCGCCLFNTSKQLVGIRFPQGRYISSSPSITCPSHPGLLAPVEDKLGRTNGPQDAGPWSCLVAVLTCYPFHSLSNPVIHYSSQQVARSPTLPIRELTHLGHLLFP
jgi:hypothetical protein